VYVNGQLDQDMGWLEGRLSVDKELSRCESCRRWGKLPQICSEQGALNFSASVNVSSQNDEQGGMEFSSVFTWQKTWSIDRVKDKLLTGNKKSYKRVKGSTEPMFQ